MDSLAFIHLAQAYDEPLPAPEPVKVNWRQVRRRSLRSILPLGIALSLFGAIAPAFALLKDGDYGAKVTQIQQRLQELGYFQADATGYYGDYTTSAVKHFQRQNGLKEDGVVGSQTEAALQATYPATPEPDTQPTVRRGDRGATVLRVQRQLSSLKYFDYRNMDGVFDAETEKAVSQFQRDRGLKVDGVVGLKTHTTLRNLTGL
jgi:peptidoglycan hydrolase-like protein with peptidoglycan-binding domain